MNYLLDTNILLRFCDADAPTHSVAEDAVALLISRGADLCFALQNAIEFWVVATRPLANNGLAWNADRAEQEVAELMTMFRLLEESPDVGGNWLWLVSRHAVQGKQAHDARLVAAMLAHGITSLLTFNDTDFVRYQEIEVINPQEL